MIIWHCRLQNGHLTRLLCINKNFQEWKLKYSWRMGLSYKIFFTHNGHFHQWMKRVPMSKSPQLFCLCYIDFIFDSSKHTIISRIYQKWHSGGSWNPTFMKTRTRLSFIVNIISADDRATEGARASASFSWDMPFAAVQRFLTINAYESVLPHI